MRTNSTALGITLALLAPVCAIAEEPAVVSELKITTLSTMLTEFAGIGEWGYSALVEADGQSILFDTGGRPDTVLKNAAELGIDLTSVDAVVLSHNHWDHTGGRTTLRRTLKEKNASAMQEAHAGDGIFLPRDFDPQALDAFPEMLQKLFVSAVDVRDEYEAEGGRFILHDKPYELHPGIWVTGPIPRIHPEKNWSPLMRVQVGESLVEDTIPEDQALVIDTSEGLVVIAGCGHAGIINTMEYARTIADGKPIHAVIGGFHLLSLSDEKLDWTGAKMRQFGTEHVIGAHCTGINAVTHLRDAGNYSRSTAAVGAVGSTFTLGEGIQLGVLNR